MSGAPRLLGLVVEGPSDARTVPGLTDRVLVAEIPSLEGDLDGARAYTGLDAGTRFLAWSRVNQEASRRPVPRRHGRFAGEIEDARTAWYALQCFVAQDPRPAAVLLVRDSDGKRDERVEGLEHARRDRAWPFQVVIGVAHPMRECWVLAGFVPRDRRETAALAALRKELKFDPTERSDHLRSLNKEVRHRPKSVLDRLVDDEDREAECWMETDLEHLRKRGAGNGLSAFLGELAARLAPIFAAG